MDPREPAEAEPEGTGPEPKRRSASCLCRFVAACGLIAAGAACAYFWFRGDGTPEESGAAGEPAVTATLSERAAALQGLSADELLERLGEEVRGLRASAGEIRERLEELAESGELTERLEALRRDLQARRDAAQSSAKATWDKIVGEADRLLGEVRRKGELAPGHLDELLRLLRVVERMKQGAENAAATPSPEGVTDR